MSTPPARESLAMAAFQQGLAMAAFQQGDH